MNGNEYTKTFHINEICFVPKISATFNQCKWNKRTHHYDSTNLHSNTINSKYTTNTYTQELLTTWDIVTRHTIVQSYSAQEFLLNHPCHLYCLRRQRQPIDKVSIINRRKKKKLNGYIAWKNISMSKTYDTWLSLIKTVESKPIVLRRLRWLVRLGKRRLHGQVNR